MKILIIQSILILISIILIIRFSSYVFGFIGIFLLYLLNYWFISIPIILGSLIITKYVRERN